MANETRTVNLYNPHDNLTGRDGGPYLDQVEAIEAEKRRAIVEDREPDLEHPPATAGIPLVTGPQLVAMSTSANIPSQERAAVDPIQHALGKVVDDDDFPVNVHTTVEQEVRENPNYNPADPTVTSTDGDDNSVDNGPGNVPATEVRNNESGNAAAAPADFPTE